ncbi:MAG TPA: RDD family protein [Gammaproteobacteria bacterium]|nr:RDD family protein [Gammaproteobacteria bacterium]
MRSEGQANYAGFWRRTAATLIDTALFSLLTLPLLYIAYGSGYFSLDSATAPLIAGPADILINYVLPLIIVVLLWVKLGATPGKMLLNCRVVDATTGQLPGVGQSILRYFAYLVSALPLMLGFLWIAWDKRKQGFHDKIAGTVVLHAIPSEADKSLEQLIGETK